MTCCFGQSSKVHPEDGAREDIFELRPGRFIHVQHFNRRPRDAKFANDMQVFTNYKKNGVVSNIAVNLSVSSNRERNNPDLNKDDRNGKHDKVNGRKVNSNDAKTQVETSQSRPTSYSKPSSAARMSSTRPGTEVSVLSQHIDNTSIMSSSNVEVTVDNKEKLNALDKFNKGAKERGDDSPSFLAGIPECETSTCTNGVKSQNGASIQCVDSINNTVLFFIHGVGGSSDLWTPQMKHFCDLGYEIVAPDMIGHGLSHGPKEKKSYQFDEILIDIEEIFDLFCKRNNVVVGHSYGCAFATVLARNRSRLVTKLVLLSGGGPTPLAPQPGVFGLPTCMLACIKPCLACLFKRQATHVPSKELAVPIEMTFDIPSYVLSYIMQGQWWPDGDEAYHSWVLTPTLLVYGDKDKLVEPWEEEEMHKTIMSSSLEAFDNVGHMIMIEAPEKLNTLLQNFIESKYEMMRSLPQRKHDEENDPDRITQRPICSPQERPESRLSTTSVKSAKSTKSMPMGWWHGRNVHVEGITSH